MRDAGFEPVGKVSNYAGLRAMPQIAPQDSGDASELGEIATAWPDLPEPLKAAVLAIVRSFHSFTVSLLYESRRIDTWGRLA